MKNSDAVIFSMSGASKEDRMFFGFSDCVPRIINNNKFANSLRTFVGPRPRRDGRAGIIQNGRLPRSNTRQPRPQGLLAFQNGGGSGEDPGPTLAHSRSRVTNEDGDVYKMAATAKRVRRTGYEMLR